MIYAFLFILATFFQQEPPFKPKEDFEIKFDFSFKQRDQLESNKTIHLDETVTEQERRTSSTPLPYLILHVKILNAQPDEVKLKVIKDNKYPVFQKKVEEGMQFKLEVGFTDDVKDKVAGYKHVVQFLSADKKVISIILIEFDEEGNYMVNGEKRGKV